MLTTVNGCWFQTKSKPIKHLSNYLKKIGRDPKKGVTRSDLKDVVKDIPAAVRWLAPSVSTVMNKCDLNRDDTITLDEVRRGSRCLVDCSKQIAITTFLN